VAFFACLYYAFLRPAEAAALTTGSCHLPKKGWGRLTLTNSAKRVPAAWTDDGTALDQRQFKHRSRDAIRVVPIPPVLVTITREHIDRFGTASDGRLFQVTRGSAAKAPSSPPRSTARLAEARTKTFTSSQQASPLAGRPYDLRHGGVTLALNAGVPAPEVAARAGHSVEVLLARLRRLHRRPRTTLEQSHRRSSR
jgi:integrase